MKIKSVLVQVLCAISYKTYDRFMTYEHNQPAIYVTMLKILYRMLVLALLYYEKFRKDLEGIGFQVNLCDSCVANRVVNGSQHTMV